MSLRRSHAQPPPVLEGLRSALTFVVVLSGVVHVGSVHADDRGSVQEQRRAAGSDTTAPHTTAPGTAGRTSGLSDPESTHAATTAPQEPEPISACSAEQQAKRTRVGWAGGTLLSLGIVGAAVASTPPLLDSDHGRIVGPLSTLPLVTGIGLLVRYGTICTDERLAADPRARVRRKRWLLGFGWGLIAAGAGLFAGGFIEGSFSSLIIMPTIGSSLGIIGLGLLVRGYRVASLETDLVDVRLGPTGITLRARF